VASGWAAVSAVALLALAGCTGSGPSAGGGSPSTTGASGSWSAGGGWSAGQPTSAAPSPAWQRTAHYAEPNHTERTVLLKLYPLQRIDGRILLTIDLVPQGTSTEVDGLDYFCYTSIACKNLGGISLVDTARLVRYRALRASSSSDTDDVETSRPNKFQLQPGTTYRYGAFFPDPGGTSTTVDLQYGGVATNVPIMDGGLTAPGLVTDAAGSVDDVTPEPVPSGTAPPQLVIFPVRRPGSTAVARPNELVANVVGGTVNEGQGGIVSVNADVLFAFDSARLTPRAKSLIAQAAQILTAKADPAKPVAVVGYTDSVGTDAYNAQLSSGRARAVVTALSATGTVAGFTLTPSGRGAKDPVAPNTLGSGVDNPAGRALNRRVEIHYTPKPAGIAATAAGGATPGGSTAAPGTGSEAPQPPSTSVGDAAPGPAVTLPVHQKVAGYQQAFSAVVYPVQRLGNLSLVQVEVTPVGSDAFASDYFSSQGRASHDVGAMNLRDPATGRVYVPARNADDPTLLMGTWVMNWMNADRAFRLSFFTAALPPQLSTVTVHVGQVGDAAGVPVTG
jgi:outer membrane protein OmpA-like peptidoglycan-associated protein